LVPCIVLGKLIRQDGDKDSDEDDLRKTDKYYPIRTSVPPLKSIHQSRPEHPELVHRIKSNVAAPKEYPYKQPSHFASGVSISTKAPKSDEEAAIQNSNDDKKFEKIFHLHMLAQSCVI
jgi:hypothetical protein